LVAELLTEQHGELRAEMRDGLAGFLQLADNDTAGSITRPADTTTAATHTGTVVLLE
jgi:hypothetical protein